MNKKQIAALAMCVATAATAVVGGTLAYFTDVADDVKNEFTIGNIDIDLWEYTDDGKKEENHAGTTYENLMPTDKLVKEPHIDNVGDNEAFVRVAVVVNNLVDINNSIDEVYENLETPKTDTEIQAIYDEVFAGWGLSYVETAAEPCRLWMDEADHKPATGSGVELLGIDMMTKINANYGLYSLSNLFMSEGEASNAESYKDGCVYFNDGQKSYYGNATKEDERIFVFYLKMDAGTDYTLFNGINVPADFTGEQMAMFDGLEIGIYADAIQTTGFADYTAAFNALEAEHPLGWWNDAE